MRVNAVRVGAQGVQVSVREHLDADLVEGLLRLEDPQLCAISGKRGVGSES